MTHIVNQTISDLKTITELLAEIDPTDTESISEIDSLLLNVHHSLLKNLNRKVREDATKRASVQAYIAELGRLYKNAILTVL